MQRLVMNIGPLKWSGLFAIDSFIIDIRHRAHVLKDNN
jgi:hypothetical protein